MQLVDMVVTYIHDLVQKYGVFSGKLPVGCNNTYTTYAAEKKGL